MSNVDATPDNTLEQALRSLRELLGEGWEVKELPQLDRPQTGAAAINSRVQITPPDGQRFAELLVITKTDPTPRYVETQLRQINNVLYHARGHQTLLITSPWISTRTQQALREQEISYLDLTGNASIAISYPSIRIETRGATKAPRALASNESTSVSTITLAGVQAGRVVRFLADRRPPYQASQVAGATEVSLPWVSRLLGRLEDQLLIRRKGRTITDVKWPDILRARAETYDLLRHNSYVSTVAVNGAAAVLTQLTKELQANSDVGPIAVTGTYAARAVAPHAVGGQLMLYVEAGPHTPDVWADRLGLMRADGGDVLLLRAYDGVVFERTREIDGTPHVALSQLVLDCLAGPGRMPAEAEKVLGHMIDHELDWRLPSPDRG